MVSQELAALRESVNLLADEIRAHDNWAKDYNVTVEARNAEVTARSQKMGEEYDAWRKQQLDAVVSVMELFHKMRDQLEDIHVTLCQPKGAKPCRAKSRTKKRK
jgi:hypothetical protein